MDLLEVLYRDYEFQLARKEGIVSALSLPLTLIPLIFSAIAYSWAKIESIADTYVFGYMVIIVVSTLILILAMIYWARAWYGDLYAALPSAKDLRQYEQALTDYYTKYGAQLPDTASSAFERYLVDQYLQHSERNRLINDRRGAFLHWAQIAIFASAILAGIAFGFNIVSSQWVTVNTLLDGRSETVVKSETAAATTTATTKPSVR